MHSPEFIKLGIMASTDISGFILRPAQESDIPALYELIRELAVYEKIENDLTATEEMLYDAIFRRKVTEVLMAEYRGELVGYAIYFYNFSSFIDCRGFTSKISTSGRSTGAGIWQIYACLLAKLALEKKCWVWSGPC